MPLVNRYYKYSKLSTVKFRYLLRLFALDLTASDAARLTGLSVRSVNTVYLLLRRRLLQLCPVPVELGGALELDESYFGPRRVRGKRGARSQWQNHRFRPVQTWGAGIHGNRPGLL